MRSWSSSCRCGRSRCSRAPAIVVAHVVLKDHADLAAQVVEVVLAQVDAVEQDAAAGRVVEPRQQFHERGLSGAVLADQGHVLARSSRKLTSCSTGVRRPDRQKLTS